MILNAIQTANAMPNSARLWLADSALSAMHRIADQYYPYETGGMLLGYVAKDSDVIVTAIIGPGPKAKHGRFRFVPDAEYQQTELETHFYKTDSRETYLGDWHTHPRGSCQLSMVDKRTLTRIARTTSSGTQHPIMAILCGDNADWKIGAVKFLSATRRFFLYEHHLTKLEPVTFKSTSE